MRGQGRVQCAMRSPRAPATATWQPLAAGQRHGASAACVDAALASAAVHPRICVICAVSTLPSALPLPWALRRRAHLRHVRRLRCAGMRVCVICAISTLPPALPLPWALRRHAHLRHVRRLRCAGMRICAIFAVCAAPACTSTSLRRLRCAICTLCAFYICAAPAPASTYLRAPHIAMCVSRDAASRLCHVRGQRQQR